MSLLAAVCLKDLSLCKECLDGELSLFALSPLLQDDFMFSLAKTFCQYHDSILGSHHEYLVCLRCHLLVHP